MTSPTLVILAAGAGSRFGGLKQLKAVDPQGHPIIDFSLYDARRAGFRQVCFVIKESMEADFRETIGDRMEKYFDVRYAHQRLDCLPAGFAVPEGREKPWGTAHAAACCRGIVNGPFAVINADDFYGAGAYRSIYEFLTGPRKAGEHAMVGYLLRNTLTENGSVSRGVCEVENGFLRSVTERVKIEKRGDAAAFLEDGKEFPLTGNETASMNFWGFGPEMLDAIWERFSAFLSGPAKDNPLRAEYYLPGVVESLLAEGKATVRVLPCTDVWHGVTYQTDLPSVQAAVAELKAAGVYPEMLWEN